MSKLYAYDPMIGGDDTTRTLRTPEAPVSLQQIGESGKGFTLKDVTKIGDTAASRKDAADMIQQNEMRDAIQIQGMDAWSRIKAGKEGPGDMLTLSIMVNNPGLGSETEGPAMDKYLRQDRVRRKLNQLRPGQGDY